MRLTAMAAPYVGGIRQMVELRTRSSLRVEEALPGVFVVVDREADIRACVDAVPH